MRAPEFITEEVRAAELSHIPWFDATELRASDRKLGLGSSAAILVASLAADKLDREENIDDATLAAAILPRALKAHAIAQPLGSGIDVVASCFGGTQIAKKNRDSVVHSMIELPSALFIELWAAPNSSSTTAMLRTLSEYRLSHPQSYSGRILEQAKASERAVIAVQSGNADAFVSALVAQRYALEALGHDAGLDIVTRELSAIADMAAKESAAVLPAGAGGGDIAVFAGPRPSSAELRCFMLKHDHVAIGVNLGVRGVHGVGAEC
jgi:phosphomevalonate kinase